MVDDTKLSYTQGTGAMVGAAATVCRYSKSGPPRAIVAGDTGEGVGSRRLYRFLIDGLAELQPEALVLHYIVPAVDQMKEVIQAAEKCPKKQVLLADAG